MFRSTSRLGGFVLFICDETLSGTVFVIILILVFFLIIDLGFDIEERVGGMLLFLVATMLCERVNQNKRSRY